MVVEIRIIMVELDFECILIFFWIWFGEREKERKKDLNFFFYLRNWKNGVDIYWVREGIRVMNFRESLVLVMLRLYV